jgi:hypothetical protein
LRALLPEALPVAQQLAWIDEARKRAPKLTEQRTPGTPPGPKGNGNVTGAAPDLLEQKRRSGQYSL